MKYRNTGKKLIIEPEGEINSSNSESFEKELRSIISENDVRNLTLDAGGLKDISDEGLKALENVLANYSGSVTIEELSPQLYKALKNEGFNKKYEIRKKMREISIEGCEIIGEGGNGIVYRLDPETIVKVYFGKKNPLDKIKQNQKVTRDVFVSGIPTTIAFDVVRVGDKYGVVYEMIDARSFAEVMREEPDKVEYYAEMIGELAKKLHSTEFKEGTLQRSVDKLYDDIDALKECGYLNQNEYARLRKLADDIPDRNTFIHQDFHPGNIMLQKGEPILIDVEDAGLGHPILDLASMYLVYVLAASSGWTKKHLGLDAKEFEKIWDTVIRTYFDTDDEKKIEEINRIIDGYARIKYIRGVARQDKVPRFIRSAIISSSKKKIFKSIDKLHPIP